MSLTRDDLKELPQLLQNDFELKLEIAQQILDDAVVARLMERDARLRETFRRAVLTEELMRLPEEFRQFREETTPRLENIELHLGNVEKDVAETKERVTTIEQDVAETKERVTTIEQDVAETKERVTTIEQDVAETKERVTTIEQDVVGVRDGVQSLQNWQRGEVGRRAGEEYERKIVRRAPRIFGAGTGGSPATSERVSEQVSLWLAQAGLMDEDVPEDSDPLDADLIWWKGDKVALAEISLKVDRDDVLRAKRRAAVLRQAGLEVLPVVIGAEWAHPETEQFANQEGVAWRVGNALSEALVAFRKAQL